jgi:hypothetical protein
MFDRAWDFGCGATCSVWLSPRLWGFAIAAAFAVIGLLITMPPFTPSEPLRRLAVAMVRGTLLSRTSDLLRRWPDAPALLTLVLASAIAATSMWSRAAVADLDPRYWVHAVMGLMALTMVAFAFATGSVLAPEPFAKLKWVDKRLLLFALVAGRPWARVSAFGRGGFALGTVVGLDSDHPRWKALRRRNWVSENHRRKGEVEDLAKRVWEERQGPSQFKR